VVGADEVEALDTAGIEVEGDRQQADDVRQGQVGLDDLVQARPEINGLGQQTLLLGLAVDGQQELHLAAAPVEVAAIAAHTGVPQGHVAVQMVEANRQGVEAVDRLVPLVPALEAVVLDRAIDGDVHPAQCVDDRLEAVEVDAGIVVDRDAEVVQDSLAQQAKATVRPADNLPALVSQVEALHRPAGDEDEHIARQGQHVDRAGRAVDGHNDHGVRAETGIGRLDLAIVA